MTVEMVLSPEEAAALEDKGVEVELKTNAEGQSVAEAATLRAEAGFNIWRPWSGTGGLQEEMEQLAETRGLGHVHVQDRLRAHDQLPLGRRTAVVRRRLAGGDADT